VTDAELTGTLHVGHVAVLLGIPRRRVQWWIERGFLRVVPDPAYCRGHYYRVTEDEIRVARGVIALQAELGVRASAKLFDHVRHGDGSAPALPTCQAACANS
jgi:hypothetical protein